MKDEQILNSKFSADDFWQKDKDEVVVKQPKNRLPKWVLICLGLVFVLGLVIIADAGNTDIPILSVVPVSRGDVIETYSASGTVASERFQVFYSPVSAPISALNVQVGDSVRKGALIVAYDLEDLDINRQHSELQLASMRYGNQGTIEMSELEKNRQASDLQEQNNREANLRSEIAEYEAKIERLRGEEAAESERINARIAEIQADRLTNRSENSQLFVERSGLMLSLQELNTTIEERDEIRDRIAILDASMATLDDELRELDRELDTAQLASFNVSTDERVSAQQELANLRFMLANMESASTFPMTNSELTSGQMQSMQVSEELLELSMLSAQELFERAEVGIKAEFDGIISSLLVREGGTAMQGGELFTLVSNQDVVVELEIPANDFDRVVVGNKAIIQLGSREYSGVVERVNRVAVSNMLGQMVIEAIVSIENPDDYVFVGVPARAILTVEERQNVLYLPTEVINMSATGHFVHVLVDGVVERRPVEIGIASNHQIEIISGIEYDELVIAEATAVDLEGVQAEPLLRE
jgi:multidrug efflux pump subunit AcrA (membrane-fusion protein)